MNRAERRRREKLGTTTLSGREIETILEEGLKHHGAGRLAQARESYGRVLQQDAQHVRALFLMGTLELQEKNYLAAESFIKQAIGQDPLDPSFHNNLGIIFRETGRLEESIASYRKAIELRPKYAEAYCNLGITQRQLGQLDDAIASLEHTIKLAPNFAGAYSSLGNAYHAVERTGDAMSAFGRALSLNPNDPSSHFHRAMTNLDHGSLDEAQEGFRDVLRLQPQHGEARRLLSNIKRFTSADDEDIQEMTRLLLDGALKTVDEMHVRFGLGKALAEIGKVEGAFQEFALANATYRKSYEYDITRDAAFFQSIADVFSEKLISDRAD